MNAQAVATILEELTAAGEEMRACAARGEYQSEGAATGSIIDLMGA